MQSINFSKLGKFHIHVFKETQEIFECLFFIDHCFSRRGLFELGQAHRMTINVLDENGGRKRRLVVQPTASITVPTGSNLKVKGTVHLVLFGAMNAGEMLGHAGSFCLSCVCCSYLGMVAGVDCLRYEEKTGGAVLCVCSLLSRVCVWCVVVGGWRSVIGHRSFCRAR